MKLAGRRYSLCQILKPDAGLGSVRSFETIGSLAVGINLPIPRGNIGNFQVTFAVQYVRVNKVSDKIFPEVMLSCEAEIPDSRSGIPKISSLRGEKTDRELALQSRISA